MDEQVTDCLPVQCHSAPDGIVRLSCKKVRAGRRKQGLFQPTRLGANGRTGATTAIRRRRLRPLVGSTIGPPFADR
jgi:hypothetical protein